MTSKLMISELEIFLKNNQPVSTQQLLEFYQTFEPDIKVNTLRWRIYQLKQNNVLSIEIITDIHADLTNRW